MASMSYDRHCAEIVAQTALLRTRLDDADLSAPVPTGPVEIRGDVPLLDAWLHAVSFWLRE
ncbi:hypothetical protein [Streptomyces noursei]|uniref:hypothetical protein n=1 Tax=Streptomyces noursei TaxID=1971 RepID=UPI003817D4F2